MAANAPYTTGIVAIILGYMWVAEPLVDVPGPWRVAAVVGRASRCASRTTASQATGDSPGAPSLPALAMVDRADGAARWRRCGSSVMRWDRRRSGAAPVLDFLYVMVWGGAPAIRAANRHLARVASGRRPRGRGAACRRDFRRAAPAEPIPRRSSRSPAGLAWCWIYSRAYPNIVPLALSHAAATVVILLSFDPAVSGGLRTGWHFFDK